MIIPNPQPVFAAMPIINPFLDNQVAENIEQLFQMEVAVPAELQLQDDERFLFGYYDREADDIIIQWGRGVQNVHWGRTLKNATLGGMLHHCFPNCNFAFTVAEWTPGGNPPPFPQLEDAAALLAISFGDLIFPGIAASFDVTATLPPQAAEHDDPQEEPAPVQQPQA